MDYFLVAAIISAVVVVILSAIVYRATKSEKGENARPRPVGQRDVGAGRAQAIRNQRARMRANAARHHPVLEEEGDQIDEPNEENIGEHENRQDVEFIDKMGTKKRAKLEAKEQKKAAREAEEQMREEKKKKDKLMEEQRKKQEAVEEEEERKREEEERRIREEKERKEQEEYEAMKAAFSVEDEGFDQSEQSGENLLQDFVKYIQDTKVVLLEELAAHFKLKTQAVIDRINSLQADGILTGVLDDRGKFIFISQKELEDVAKFIKQRGRVSITDLAESSNQLINLNPLPVS